MKRDCKKCRHGIILGNDGKPTGDVECRAMPPQLAMESTEAVWPIVRSSDTVYGCAAFRRKPLSQEQ